MQRLIIVGAGGLGREVFSWASHHPDCGQVWNIAGFIDDNLTALDNFSYPVKVINSISNKVNKSQILNRFSLKKDEFIVVSIHREENVDSQRKLKKLITML